MTETPRFLDGRPAPPEIGSDTDKYWRKERALNYEGGYIKAAFGNLAQTFIWTDGLPMCDGKDISTTVKGHDRYNTIGGTKTTVSQFSKNYKVYPGRTSSMAAGGDKIRIVTDIGEYTARLGGDIQSMVKYLCDNRSSMYSLVYIYSSRGKEYGPFGPGSVT